MEKTVRHRDIKNIDPPKVLYYGDSHMGRLKWWADGDYGRFKPNELEKLVLSGSRFAYSGGSHWSDVHQRVNGINLPVHQKQGDTWGPIVKSDFVPDYIFMSCGSNTLDLYNDQYFVRIRNSPIWHLLLDVLYGPSKFFQDKYPAICDLRCPPRGKVLDFDSKLFIDTAYDDICKDVKVVMTEINAVYDSTRKYGLSCIIRKYWFPAIRVLACRINGYMSKTHHVTMNQINGFLEPKHICKDDIHMNAMGYRVFVEKGLGPMLDSYYNLHRLPKSLRNPPKMSKSAKRRQRKSLKKFAE